MPRRPLTRLLVVLPLAGLLSSCALSAQETPAPSDAPSLPTTLGAAEPTTNLHTSAAPGAIASRGGSFGVAPPSGWVDETAKQLATVLYLRSRQPNGRVYPTFTVIKTPSKKKPPPLSELVEQGMIGQRQKGATVTKLGDRSIGGVPASGYQLKRIATPAASSTTSESPAAAVPVIQTQYYVVQGQHIYVATTTSSAADAGQAGKIQDAILGSWSWGPPPPPDASTSTAPGGTPSPSTSGR